MRGLIVRTNYLYSKDIRKSTWPEDISDYSNFDKKPKEFSNVINLWICIEKEDKEQYLKSLIKRIKDLNKQFYKLNHIVVLPFAHLSNNLAHPQKSRELLSKLVDLLKKEKFQVDIISFGTHKNFNFEMPGQPAAVSYFEFPYLGKKPKVN